MGTTSESQIESPTSMNIRISRGSHEEVPLQDIEKLKDCVVYDWQGKQKRFGDVVACKKSIVVFPRHFLCFTSEEYIQDLAMIPKEMLEAANVQLVVIGCANSRFIRCFRDQTNYKHSFYCDPGRKLHDILHFKKNMVMGSPAESKHLKSGAVLGLIKTTWRAMESMEWQGDSKQQGGALVIDTDGNILFSYISDHATDQVPINTLLQHAGMTTVSFPNDQQVLDL